MSPAEEIVPLTPELAPAAGDVLDAAFERRGMLANLRLAHALQGENWLCAQRDGQMVAVVGAYNYGPFASIGMMAVHPSAQRQGVGERLMAALIDLLARRGCPVLFLDASAAGQRLYPRLCFVPEGETLRMMPPAGRFGADATLPGPDVEMPRVGPMVERDLAEVAAFDAPFFGANRSVVLGIYRQVAPERALLTRDADGGLTGYIMSAGAHVGPWTAATPVAAEALLRATLRLPFDRAPFLTAPAENAVAMELLARYGFAVTERLLHMRLGGDRDPRRVRFLYGQASLTLG